jgi:hypothetical protein
MNGLPIEQFFASVSLSIFGIGLFDFDTLGLHFGVVFLSYLFTVY